MLDRRSKYFDDLLANQYTDALILIYELKSNARTTNPSCSRDTLKDGQRLRK
jgi:hypothetical protein